MATPYSRYLIGPLAWYSVLMVGGILLAYWIGTREEKRLGLPQDSMLDMVLVAVPSGIVGARLYYVLMSLDQFVANPIRMFYIWEGGIAVYGSILGGALGLWIYCHIRKRSFTALLDIAAPGLALAQAVGRWGNYFNQEAYGPAVLDPAWQFFPFAVLIRNGGTPSWHVATFFYESTWDVGVFIVLWVLRKRVRRRGDLFLWYLALYGAGRFLVEQLRQDSLYLFGLRASQWLSLAMIVAVAAVFLARFWQQASIRQRVAALLGCVLAPARLLLPATTWGTGVVLALYAATVALSVTDARVGRLARWWPLGDAAVYGALLLLGLQGLWHSPYFVYAGLSIPVYLSIPYFRTAQAGPTAQSAVQEV